MDKPLFAPARSANGRRSGGDLLSQHSTGRDAMAKDKEVTRQERLPRSPRAFFKISRAPSEQQGQSRGDSAARAARPCRRGGRVSRDWAADPKGRSFQASPGVPDRAAELICPRGRGSKSWAQGFIYAPSALSEGGSI